jgi:hypothetical protein
MYKIVCHHQEHTGGGDGDDDTDDGTDAEDDIEPKKVDGDEKKHKKPTKTAQGRFSKKSLDAFEESVYYELIDVV